MTSDGLGHRQRNKPHRHSPLLLRLIRNRPLFGHDETTTYVLEMHCCGAGAMVRLLRTW